MLAGALGYNGEIRLYDKEPVHCITLTKHGLAVGARYRTKLFLDMECVREQKTMCFSSL